MMHLHQIELQMLRFGSLNSSSTHPIFRKLMNKRILFGLWFVFFFFLIFFPLYPGLLFHLIAILFLKKK